LQQKSGISSKKVEIFFQPALISYQELATLPLSHFLLGFTARVSTEVLFLLPAEYGIF
jgi:hypothetical protein